MIITAKDEIEQDDTYIYELVSIDSYEALVAYLVRDKVGYSEAGKLVHILMDWIKGDNIPEDHHLTRLLNNIHRYRTERY